MCDSPIISRELIREKARDDFAAGKGRDEHGFNWHAAALEDWQQEWDKQAGAQRVAELEAV